MKVVDQYVNVVNKVLDEPRKELVRKQMEKPNRNLQKLIDKYDRELFEQYKHIEKLLDEELEFQNREELKLQKREELKD